MPMRTICACLLLLASACAHGGPPAAGAPETTADVGGRWLVTISLDGETIPGLALLIQTGARVTGSMGPDADNQHPLEGVVEGNRVAITMRPRPGRTTAFDTCELTVAGETLSGSTAGGPAGGATIRLVRQPE
jgi:hypothetical protein